MSNTLTVKPRILQDQTKTHEIVAMMAEMAKLKAENEALKLAKANHKSRIKVSEKGAVSVYGMGRWPVTLYRSQWEALLAAKEEIEAFIQTNAHLLATKGE